MLPHAHISLCDEKWVIYYDYIDFDIRSSVVKFLDLILEMFNPKGISIKDVESYMYSHVDDNISSPLYFKINDLIYLWVICTGCHANSLN